MRLPAPHLPAPCRAADGLDTCPIPPKQARPENGEYGPSTTGQSSAFQLSTDSSSGTLSLGNRPLGGKEALRATGPVSPPEEGAERIKHSKTRAGGRWPGLGQRPASRWLFDQNLVPVFSPPSQEGNRKHPRSLRGSSHPSQEPSDSKVRPQPAGHLGGWAAAGCSCPGPTPASPHTCAHRPGQG